MEEKFAEIYTTYKEFVWNLTSRYFQSQMDREEAFQETFVKVYRYIPHYKEQEQDYFKTWLYKVTMTTSINLFKKQKRTQLLRDLLDFNKHLFSGAPDPEHVDAGEEDGVSFILSPLNADQRAVILLREIEGLAYEEIAEVMNMKVGTVKSTLNRAKNKMRDYLAKEGKVHGTEGVY